jgi:four helix bundle protein
MKILRATTKVATNGGSVVQEADSDSAYGVKARKYDLEDRMLEYAADVIRFTDVMTKSDAGRHVAGQLLRSGTSPLAHQGEAQAAESSKDFIHKMKVALKELRESCRWLKLALRVPLTRDVSRGHKLLAETDELIRIFFASIRTAKGNSTRSQSPRP